MGSWRRSVKSPNPSTPHAVAQIEYQSVAGLIRRYLLHDQWVVDIEADSGERLRTASDSREGAIEQARHPHAGIQQDGVAFLRTLQG